MEISSERLKQLEASEAKLAALEAAGVKGWHGYRFAMYELNKQERIDEQITISIGKALACLNENPNNTSSYVKAFDVLKECIYNLK
jgi:hypothetical protein